VIARWPLPSSWTLARLLVIVSVSPVPKPLPGPTSYFQLAELGAVPAAPSKSSRHRSVNPAGGAAVTSAGEATALADAPADADGVVAADPQPAAPNTTALPSATAEMSDWPRRREVRVCEYVIS